jgi:hypothetical protein
MGAINNAFNQAAGAVAGAAVAIKNTKEAELSKTLSADNSALVARNQAREADAQAAEATNEAEKEGGLIEQLSNAEVAEEYAYKALDRAKRRKNASPITILERRADVRAAERARRSLKDKYDAVTGMRDRAKEQRMHAHALTESAIKLRTKYKSRWGGIE